MMTTDNGQQTLPILILIYNKGINYFFKSSLFYKTNWVLFRNFVKAFVIYANNIIL